MLSLFSFSINAALGPQRSEVNTILICNPKCEFLHLGWVGGSGLYFLSWGVAVLVVGGG